MPAAPWVLLLPPVANVLVPLCQFQCQNLSISHSCLEVFFPFVFQNCFTFRLSSILQQSLEQSCISVCCSLLLWAIHCPTGGKHPMRETMKLLVLGGDLPPHKSLASTHRIANLKESNTLARQTKAKMGQVRLRKCVLGPDMPPSCWPVLWADSTSWCLAFLFPALHPCRKNRQGENSSQEVY